MMFEELYACMCIISKVKRKEIKRTKSIQIYLRMLLLVQSFAECWQDIILKLYSSDQN